jgi:hypothetical protein
MKKLYSLFALSLLVAPMSAQAPATYSIEKDIIHSYLTDFDYDTMDINISLVMDYFNMPHVTDAGKPATAPENRLDAPAPYRITWTHQDGADAQRVEIALDSRFARGLKSFTVNKDSSAYDLYNMIPGEIVFYRVVSVKNDEETTVTSGTLNPQGMLRWIYAEGTWNVRDMGGWTGLGGNPIKYGQLFRGGQLTNPKDPYNVLLTSAGIEAMRNAGIRAELDLRSSSQAHYSYASFAVKDGSGKYDADFTNIATTSARMWHYDADNSNIKAFQWIINELKAGKPVFYHCQNGADRTGTMGLLIGALCGMSDGDLAKDYELTTFCQEAAVDFDGTEVGFARLRNYEGKKGSVDASSNPKDYMFAPVIDKWKEMSGTTQRKVYNFFKTGVSGTKISSADLIWFIKYMTGYTVVDDITHDGDVLITLNKRMVFDLNAKTYPEDATNGTITYTSSNPTIATVDDDGIITAWTAGEATITMKADDFVKTVKVNVPKIESIVPQTVQIGGESYPIKTPLVNKVSDGSFEYGNYGSWLNGAGTTLSDTYFSLKRYQEDQDTLYLESKIDGDETSEGSIRMEFTTPKKRTYVLGFRIKNSTDLVTVKNPNLKIMLTTDGAADDDPNATILEYPSYSGEWTEIQYVFSTKSDYNRTRLIFTHLSQNGNNTCFDNFYLTDVNVPSAVNMIQSQPEWARTYDINGREVDVNTRGLKIINGKKVLISE